jgi:hypothetical protein
MRPDDLEGRKSWLTRVFELRQLMLVNIMIRVKMAEFAFPQMEAQFVNAATLTLMASTADKAKNLLKLPLLDLSS